MKRIILTTAFALVLMSATVARAQCAGPKRITFQPGTTTAVLKGSVPASKAMCYELRVRAGQKMIVHVTSPANGVSFNVIPEGYDVEPLAGAENVTNWEGVLDETGDYTISVHAARAGLLYTLEVSIPAAARTTTSGRSTVAQCGDFSGVYQTDYGPLRLTRTGDQVRGSYSSSYTEGGPQDGTLSGTVRGNVLTGRWSQPDSKGTFRFTLNSGGRSFKGSFGVSGRPNDGDEWNGHCR